MATFTFTAAKQNGELITGNREAESEKTLAQALRSEGFFLLKVEGKGSSLVKTDFKIKISAFISRIRPVGIVEKMFFTKNLSVMIKAGLSLTRALDALAQQASNSKFRKIIEEINGSIVKGRTLAESLKPHEDVFGLLYVNMMEVGEMTGKLGLVLKLLANQMKKDYELRKRVKGAMMYPLIVIIALFLIGGLMMVYVIPTLSETIKGLGVPLPVTTQVVIFTSDFIVNHTLEILGGIILSVVACWKLLRTRRGKIYFDRFIVRVPIFGALVKKFNSARFSRTLAYLVASGVPIVRALEIVSKVVGNTLYQQASMQAASEIQKGKLLNEIIAGYPNIFPPMVIQMIKVGEETGKITSLLLRVAIFFEGEVEETTKNLSTVIEPVLMIVIGTVVGFFAVSMLQPIYGSLNSIQ